MVRKLGKVDSSSLGHNKIVSIELSSLLATTSTHLFSSPITTMSSFFVQKISNSLVSTAPMFIVVVEKFYGVSTQSQTSFTS